MRSRRWIALFTGVAVVGLLIGMVTPAASQGKAPEATEVGVTEDEIRIAVIADVDNPAAPGIFEGAKDGVEAWGDYINNSCKPKNTCLAGRKVVVDFIDSKLSADAARDAVIKACEEDFAMVGTTMIFFNNIAPEIDCVDQAGAATGIPDVASFQTSFDHQCSPVAYTISGSIMDCATKDEHPQTYRGNTGPARYLKKKFKFEHGSWVASNDLKGPLDATLPLMQAEREVNDLTGEDFLISAAAPQTEYTPYVQGLQRDGAEFVSVYADCNSLMNVQREALVQGVDIQVYLSTQSCYTDAILDEPASEGTFLWMPYLPPLEEASTNKALKAMLKAIGEDEIDGFGILAWQSALLFRDAVNAVVDKQGVNGLTRANLLDAFANMDSFDADGMRGNINVGTKTGSGCFVLMKVTNGKFVREFPKKKGTLSCVESDYSEVEYDNEA